MNTRTGKIARLPQPIRDQLNHKLEDGVGGPEILAWLNGMWKVQEILGLRFGGEPISPQNLSVWRQGGFVDWQRHQVSRETAREFVAELEEMEAEVGPASLGDRVSQMVALMMGRLLREAMAGEASERRKAVLEIARELARLRRGDRAQQRANLAQEQHEAAVEETQRCEREYIEAKRTHYRKELRANEAVLRAEAERGLADGTLTEERREELDRVFNRLDEHFGRPPRPKSAPAGSRPKTRPDTGGPRANQSNSNQIKVNQACRENGARPGQATQVFDPLIAGLCDPDAESF